MRIPTEAERSHIYTQLANALDTRSAEFLVGLLPSDQDDRLATRKDLHILKGEIVAELTEKIGAAETRSNGTIDALGTRLNDTIEATETRSNDTIDALGTRLDDRIEATEARLNDTIDTLGTRLDDKIEATEARLDTKIDTFGIRLDNKIEALGTRLDNKIEALSTRMTALLIAVLLAVMGAMATVYFAPDRPAPQTPAIVERTE